MITQLKRIIIPPQVIAILASLLIFNLSLNQVRVTNLDVDELFEIQQFVAFPLINMFTNYWANGQLPHILLTKVFATISWDIFNLRFGSIIAGTLCIPLIYRLTGYLFDKRVAALSAFLLSVTITHIRYSAYARGYSLLVMISLVAIYCFSKAVKTGHTKWWIGLAIALAINIHNHAFTIFLAVVLAILIAGSALRQPKHILTLHKQKLQNIGIAGGLTFLLLLPIPILIWTNQKTTNSLSILLANEWPTSFPPFNLSQPLNILTPLIQMSYTFSPTRYPGWQTYGFIGLFLMGTLVGLKRVRFRWNTIMLLLIVFLSPFLMTVATSILGPWFYALRRYFLFVMPPYLILASLGMLWLAILLARVLSTAFKSYNLNFNYLIILPLLLVPTILPIFSVVKDSLEHNHSNPFTIGRYIHNHAQASDIILCVPDTDWVISTGREDCTLTLNLYPDLAPNIYYLDKLAAYETLQEFLNPDTDCVNEYIHLPHPDFTMDCRANSHTNQSPNIWLILWRTRGVSSEAARVDPPHPLVAQRFDATDIIYIESQNGLVNSLIQAGKITLQESKTPLRKLENYVSLATIYTASGQVDQALATLDEAAFVSRWPEAIERLTKLQAQLSYLPVAFEPKILTNIVWNEQIMLIGIDQDLQTIEPTPGNPIQVSFYWQVLRPFSTNDQFLLQLLNDQGTPIAIFDYQPFDGYRPLTDWIPLQNVRETRTFNLPSNLSPGTYSLVLGIYNRDTLERLPITNGTTRNEWTLAEWKIK